MRDSFLFEQQVFQAIHAYKVVLNAFRGGGMNSLVVFHSHLSTISGKLRDQSAVVLVFAAYCSQASTIMFLSLWLMRMMHDSHEGE